MDFCSDRQTVDSLEALPEARIEDERLNGAPDAKRAKLETPSTNRCISSLAKSIMAAFPLI